MGKMFPVRTKLDKEPPSTADSHRTAAGLVLLNEAPAEYRELPPAKDFRAIGAKCIVHASRLTIQSRLMHGILHLAPNPGNLGQYAAEGATVTSAGPDLSNVKTGDAALLKYYVFNDEMHRGKIQPNINHLETDRDGNQTRWADDSLLVGVQDGDALKPLKGYVFCDPPPAEMWVHPVFELPEQQQDTDANGYYARVTAVHPDDAAAYGIAVGSWIFCPRNSDVNLRLYDRVPRIRVILSHVYGVFDGQPEPQVVQTPKA